MLTNPVLLSIVPFNAINAHTIVFQVSGGDQINKNNLIIERISPALVVYDQIVNSFRSEHTIPAGTLTNGVQFRLRIKTGDINNNWSDWSNSVIVTPIADPTLLITNITTPITSQNFFFQGSYTQAQNELVESHRWRLYNNNQVLISTSAWKFDSMFRVGSTTIVEHEFTNLENETSYYIDFQIRTRNGLEAVSNKYPFTTKYAQPIMQTPILLENVPRKAGVEISAQAIRIVGEIISGTISYEGDEWVNLKKGTIGFIKGFNLVQDYTIRMWAKNIDDDQWFLKLVSNEGRLELIKQTKYYREYTKASSTSISGNSNLTLVGTSTFPTRYSYRPNSSGIPQFTITTNSVNNSDVSLRFKITSESSSVGQIRWGVNPNINQLKRFVVKPGTNEYSINLNVNTSLNRIQFEVGTPNELITFENFEMWVGAQKNNVKLYAYIYSILHNARYTMFSNEIIYNPNSIIFIFFQHKDNLLYLKAEVLA